MMKSRFWGSLFAAVLLVGCLTGCGSSEDTMLAPNIEYSYNSTTVSLNFVSLSSSVTAPLSSGAAGTLNTYYAPDENGDTQRASYLDCIATVTNHGDKSLDLSDAMLLYAADNSKTYADCLLFTESEDGSALTDADALAAGESTRLHYVLILPKDANAADYTLSLSTTSADGESILYTAPVSGFAPTADSFAKNVTLSGSSGTTLTMQSADTTDTITPTDVVNSKASITVSQDGNVLVDVAMTAVAGADTSVGSLCGGYMVSDTAVVRAVPVLETGDSLMLSGALSAGAPATVHLVFELSSKPAHGDSFYLYLDGVWYPIDV